MKDTKIRPITSKVFRSRYKELKTLLIGKAELIGEMAGADDTRFANAISGRIKSPELLTPLYEAMEAVAKEEHKKIEL